MRFSSDAASDDGSRVTLRGSYGLFIGGSFVSGSSVFKTISPATEEVLAEVTHGTTEDVDRAVAAARQAYERTWSVMPWRERGKYLFRIARLIQERARERTVAPPIVVDVLKRYPAAPPGGGRVGALIRQLDAALRA